MVVAVEALHVRGQAALVIEVLPIHPVICRDRELAQESTQAARVALPEWMNGIHLSVVMGQPVDERLMIEADQVVLLRKLGKYALRVPGDMLRAGVESIGLRDLNGTQFSRPRIQIAEDMTVKDLPVRQVVAAGERFIVESRQGDANNVRLSHRELPRMTNLQIVGKDIGAWIDIRILRHQKSRPVS